MLLGAKLKCQQDEEGWERILSSMDYRGVERTSLAQSILPPRWRPAIVHVLEMLRVWEVESKDVARLREIVETLLRFCSQ